jgi:hypothetical protein
MNGIWIRSQDGEALICTSYITYERNWCGGDGCVFCNAIIVQVADTEVCMSVYPTEERAKEVIDEIQKYLTQSGTIQMGLIGDTETLLYAGVFEMPKE